MPQVYDIRGQIPQPVKMYEKPYEFQPYPKMMIMPDTPDRPNPRKKPFKHPDGRDVIVQSEAEEKAFWAEHAPVSPPDAVVEKPNVVEIPIAAIAPARHQFEALDPTEAMKAIKSNEAVREKRKYTRKLAP